MRVRKLRRTPCGDEFMSFYREHDLMPKCQPTSESEVTELRIARGFYTYFGWFPWKDFEGESFPEETVCQLTGGRAATPMPAVTAGAEGDPNEEVDAPT
jgi:hypothetical protein